MSPDDGTPCIGKTPSSLTSHGLHLIMSTFYVDNPSLNLRQYLVKLKSFFIAKVIIMIVVSSLYW